MPDKTDKNIPLKEKELMITFNKMINFCYMKEDVVIALQNFKKILDKKDDIKLLAKYEKEFGNFEAGK